jgi:integrase
MTRTKANVGLTDAKIAALKAPATGIREEHPDQVVKGLRVRIGAAGKKTFILRKRVGGAIKNITLGHYGPRFTLADARKKARDLLVDIEGGKDPTLTLRTPRRGGLDHTVSAMVETFLATEVRGKKRSSREIERILTNYIVPAIGNRLADSITRADVTKLIDGVIHADPERPTRAMGRAVFAQLSAFYTWAMPRLDRLPANPCRDAGRPAPSKARERVLTEDEIRAFWAACGKLEWPFGSGFKLLLLTGQRRSEVFEAARTEFTPGQWVIPAERSKNGAANIVPISVLAQQVIDDLPETVGSPFMFPSRSASVTAVSGFSKATARLIKNMAEVLEVDEIAPFVLHDLRRTTATGMQRLGTPMPVVEAVLNHVSGSRAGVAGIYQRHDYLAEKKQALGLWADEVKRITSKRKVTPEPKRKAGDNVIPMRRGRV